MSGESSPTPNGVAEQIEAAFFDLDNTIISKASMAAFRRPLHAGGLITRRSITRALFARFVHLHLGASDKRLVRIQTSLLRITKGWNRDEVVAIVNEALEEIVDPIIFAEAMDLIENHQAAGREVVIVSAAPEEIVVPLARHLGITEAIASRVGIDTERRYTGELSFSAFGAFKADAMRDLAERRGIDLSRSFAYSDSFSDIAMLEAVGHPVCVNPDRDLARLAKDRGWEVLRFVRPVQLRDRVRDRVHAVPDRKVTMWGATAAIIALAAAGLRWWYGTRRGNRLLEDNQIRVV